MIRKIIISDKEAVYKCSSVDDNLRVLTKKALMQTYSVTFESKGENLYNKKLFSYTNIEHIDDYEFIQGSLMGIIVNSEDAYKYTTVDELVPLLQKLCKCCNKGPMPQRICMDDWGLWHKSKVNATFNCIMIKERGMSDEENKEEIAQKLKELNIQKLFIVQREIVSKYIALKRLKDTIVLYDIKKNSYINRKSNWIASHIEEMIPNTVKVDGNKISIRLVNGLFECDLDLKNNDDKIKEVLSRLKIVTNSQITIDDTGRLAELKSQSNRLTVPNNPLINSIGKDAIKLTHPFSDEEFSITIYNNIKKCSKRAVTSHYWKGSYTIYYKGNRRSVIKDLMCGICLSKSRYKNIKLVLHDIRDTNVIKDILKYGYNVKQIEFADGCFDKFKCNTKGLKDMFSITPEDKKLAIIEGNKGNYHNHYIDTVRSILKCNMYVYNKISEFINNKDLDEAYNNKIEYLNHIIQFLEELSNIYKLFESNFRNNCVKAKLNIKDLIEIQSIRDSLSGTIGSFKHRRVDILNNRVKVQDTISIKDDICSVIIECNNSVQKKVVNEIVFERWSNFEDVTDNIVYDKSVISINKLQKCHKGC